MADDRDEAWLRALAGRAAPDLPPESRREVEALRRAIGAARNPNDSAADARELERLLFRLRRERLLDPAPRSSSRTWLPLAAAAALVLALAPMLRSPDVPRPDGAAAVGSRLEIQIVETPDVERAAAEIAAALRAAGIEPHDAAPGGERGLRASIPPDKIEAARQALEKLGITVPADGELRVELRGK
ncbi:MAG: hypothetical protein U1F45_19950 [Burkholderiales bacterium]